MWCGCCGNRASPAEKTPGRTADVQPVWQQLFLFLCFLHLCLLKLQELQELRQKFIMHMSSFEYLLNVSNADVDGIRPCR